MKKGNPFTLMFGRLPQTIISRTEISNEIMEGFTTEYPPYQTYLISGVRGSGKTVLMTSVAKELRESGDWIIVDLNATQPLLAEFAERLADACKRMPNFWEKGLDVSAFSFSIGIGGVATTRDSVSSIERLLEYVQKKGKKVLVTIDEVSNNQDMRIFASQFQIFARKDYPLFLIMTGLYENIYAIQNDSALTFLLRSPKAFLSPLNLRQIAGQYQRLLNVDDVQAESMAKMTKGYAFAFQALGMLYFENRDTLSNEQISDKLDDILDEYVYQKIWTTLSPVEKRIVLCLSDSESVSKADICQKGDICPQSFSKYRERLIGKGIVFSPQRGSLTLALPRFGKITKTYAALGM